MNQKTKLKKRIFKILETANFYFPVIDKGRKFVILDSIHFEIDKSYFKIQGIFLKNKTIELKLYAEPIWKEIKEFIKGKKEYKKCWFVPTRIDSIGDKFMAYVDILK